MADRRALPSDLSAGGTRTAGEPRSLVAGPSQLHTAPLRQGAHTNTQTQWAGTWTGRAGLGRAGSGAGRAAALCARRCRPVAGTKSAGPGSIGPSHAMVVTLRLPRCQDAGQVRRPAVGLCLTGS